METQENEIIYINIGGYNITTTRYTLKQSGMSYFKSFFNAKFEKINYDRNGNIFIDRDQEEAKFIDSFIRTHTLPSRCNLKVAKRVAVFYGSPEIERLIAEKKNKKKKERNIKKKMSSQKVAEAIASCPECGKSYNSLIYPQKDTYFWVNDAITHLVQKHKAEIDAFNVININALILYRVPEH